VHRKIARSGNIIRIMTRTNVPTGSSERRNVAVAVEDGLAPRAFQPGIVFHHAV
jgi:hypothetical protein